MPGSNIVFVLTGSIAGYKACEVISRLMQQGHRMRVVATESALRFVGEATLEGLTGKRVLIDLWTPGAALDHIELTRWADLVVVCPATADLLAKMAAGIADDLATTLLLATDKPVVVAPAMNVRMWRHAATQRNVAQLKADGVRVIDPAEGEMACGEFGPGRLPEPQHVVDWLARTNSSPRLLGEGNQRSWWRGN